MYFLNSSKFIFNDHQYLNKDIKVVLINVCLNIDNVVKFKPFI